jgi:uncharacterized protein (DUF1800 family)
MDTNPWHGLEGDRAAAHLLNRFAFGPRPGEVARLHQQGLAVWIEAQLAGRLPEARLEATLARFETLRLPAEEIARTYPPPGLILRQAMAAGEVTAPIEGQPVETPPAEAGRDPRRRREVMGFAREQGYRSQRTLLAELLAWKLYRACYAENQLREVLTDFWFNHFYVSLADNEARGAVLAYERDTLRPHVLGKFRTLLGKVARDPAMLLYLDNARSSAAQGQPTLAAQRAPRGRRGRRPDRPEAQRRSTGLNENYARELLELHTLGVDGGYTQQDVVEVARAFSGWTVVPPGRDAEVERRLGRARRAGSVGFVVDGLFLFRADAHDAGAKRVLGTSLPAGRGLEDGEQVLDLLARHPATARHLATKLAVRFVADAPPASLVDRLAATFRATDGDLAAVTRALLASPELWAAEAQRAKIKSPFELAVSALRATNAELDGATGVLDWVARMGQPLYQYQAPTGYPDRAEQWVSTGALLARMNFGLELASGRVAGARLDLPALVGGHEPASREEALAAFLPRLLPGRDTAAQLAQLKPIAEAPALADKVAARAEAAEATVQPGSPEAALEPAMEPDPDLPAPRAPRRRSSAAEPSALEQVVGVILGSPEFQRR